MKSDDQGEKQSVIDKALIPFASMELPLEKASHYFANDFRKDLALKMELIQREDLVEPKAYLAAPALQALALSFNEPELRDMYVSLLACSMNRKSAADAHPGFVDVIRQLDPEESGLLQLFLASSEPMPVAQIRLAEGKTTGTQVLLKHIIAVGLQETQQHVSSYRFQSWVENWIRLHLVEVDYASSLRDKRSYRWVVDRPEVKQLCLRHGKHKLRIRPGVITRTTFGYQFAKAVGLI